MDHAFGKGEPFRVGIEEELLLVDDRSHRLSPVAVDVHVAKLRRVAIGDADEEAKDDRPAIAGVDDAAVVAEHKIRMARDLAARRVH